MHYYFNLRVENGNVVMWVFITSCTYLSSGLGSRGGAGPTGPWFMGSNPAPERITILTEFWDTKNWHTRIF